jgi:hypothetical protein
MMLKNIINVEEYKTNPNYNTPTINPESVNFKNPANIIIYPECVAGNPLRAEKVVRWILYYADDKIITTWKDLDLKILYSELFGSNLPSAEPEILSIFETQKDFFKDLGQKREGNCFMVKKGGANRERILNSKDTGKYEKPGDFEIFGGRKARGRSAEPIASMDDLLEIFNKYKRFYSYDCETYISTIAALCGCESVIVPDPTKSKQNILSQEYLKHGVAYGLDDLDRANETRAQLRVDLEKLEKQNITNVEKFINITYEKFTQ